MTRERETNNIQVEIHRVEKRWKELKNINKYIKEEVKMMTEKEEQDWRKEERRIFWKEWAYVPDLATLQESIKWEHYDYELAGHLEDI